MTKKVPCRVVKSVPLRKSSYELRHAATSSDKHRRAGDDDALNVREKRVGNSAAYAGRLSMAGVSIGGALSGSILDCYV